MADLVLPPRDVGERQTLLDMLDYYRKVLIRKADGLTVDQLQQELAPSDLTIGRLLRHMALVEDIWFHWRFLDGGPLREWGDPRVDGAFEGMMYTADGESAQTLIEQMHTSIARSDAVVAGVDTLDASAANPAFDGQYPNMRWILVHMIEEYARHCGHADFIRESIDGRTGD